MIADTRRISGGVNLMAELMKEFMSAGGKIKQTGS